jgi:sulfonate transport system permease protein
MTDATLVRPLDRLRALNWSGILYATAGLAALVLLWQLAVIFISSGNGTIPSPLQIARQMHFDGFAFYADAASYTVSAAFRGWLWGNSLAILLALVAVAIPFLERPILQLGIVSYCLPIVAIGPLMMILFSGDTPKVVLAALSVFFTTLIGTVTGLRHVDRTMLDLVHGFGGGTWHKLFKVRLISALPHLFAALRIAAPAAILGAIVGEYMGGTETGLGLMLVNSQQAMEIPRTWAIAVVASVLAAIAYAATSLVARLMTPWAREVSTDIGGLHAKADAGGGWAMAITSALGSLGLVLFVWWAILRGFSVPPFFGKGPLEVWNYLVDPLMGAQNRAQLMREAVVTIRDSAAGLVVGTIAAVLVAIAFNLWGGVERAFMGVAIALRSIPLVAMAPLVTLVFGRNMLAVVMIGAIVTFFPTLVNMTLALAQTPARSRDLMKVFGASRFKTLMTVQIPSALPALFTSLRTAAPLAITGALLAAWLATGKGLGYAIVTTAAVSDYEGLWARVALTTAFSILLYALIGLVERIVLKAYAN